MKYNAPLKEYHSILKCLNFNDSNVSLKEANALLKKINDFSTKELLPLFPYDHLQFDNVKHIVKLPKGYKAIYKKMCQLGFQSFEHPKSIGGKGIPKAISCLIQEILMSCNSAFFLGMSLTQSAVIALNEFGSSTLKNQYLNDMVNGTLAGSMCLTESHCGTDLGLIKSKAIPKNGYYEIHGSKIWITFGEHDLTKNIAHLVLAKLPDAPEGSKGISLFLVPKYLNDGSKNHLHCSALEHKMGNHLSPTCTMQFEGAKGWLIGEPNKGLKAMFIMMNDARLSVANQGIALSEIALQKAKNHLGKLKKENYFIKKAYAYHIPMRGLMVYTCQKVDQKDYERVGLLTPTLKSYFTEKGCDHINTALTIGQTRDNESESNIFQHYIDARISMIYEGTNGIQALDLVMRKLPRDNYNAIDKLLEDIEKQKIPEKFIAKAYHLDILHLFHMCYDLMKRYLEEDLECAATCAPYFLKSFALFLLSYMWMKQYTPHNEELCELFHKEALKEIEVYLTKIEAGKHAIVDFKVEYF